MEIHLCRHIKTNGTQCGSPALAAQAFCFYHARLHRGHAGFRRALAGDEAPGSAPRLQLACMNAARLNPAPFPPDVLTETTSTPEGLDLALPGATRTLPTNIADEEYESGEVQEDEADEEDDDELDEELELLRKKAYGDDYPSHASAA